MGRDLVVGQRANPTEESARRPASDEEQVILIEELRDGLVVARRRRVLDRFDRQTLGT